MTTAELVTTDTGTLPALAGRLETYGRLARGAFAANTEKARRADSRIFADWCIGAGCRSLPATPATVAAFLEAQAAAKSVATVRRYAASIAHLHRAAKVEDPTATEEVRLTLRRIAKEKGTASKQADALTRRAVDRMLDAAPKTLQGARDCALLAVAYDSACRRSELVALDVEDVTPGEDGAAVALIRRSKTDQEGKGRVVLLAPDTVARLTAWLSAAGIGEGPIFRPVRKGGRTVGANRLGDDAVAEIFKGMARRVEIDATNVSGHSTRVGFAQDTAALGCSLPEIMQAGGWKSPTMVARYSEKQNARFGAAAKLARAQGRF